MGDAMNFDFGASFCNSFFNRTCGFVFVLAALFGVGIAQYKILENQNGRSIAAGSIEQELDNNSRRDLDRLQGAWQLVLREYQGELLDTQGVVLTIEGNEFRTVDENGKLVEAGTIALHEDESPKADDTTVVAGLESKGNVYRSIYRIKGDTYQTCVNIDPNGERPTEFCSDEENTNQMMVWCRIARESSD